MNISNQIQIIYVPWWIRVLVSLVILCSILVCAYLFGRALIDGDKPDWIAAGAYLLGIVFPISVVVILIAGASFGERSIIKRTEHVLTQTIPYHLRFIPEEPRSFVDFGNRRRVQKSDESALAKVSIFHTKGRCYADYIVSVPFGEIQLELMMRVELNVRRANVNVLFSRAKLNQLMQASDCTGAVESFVKSQFPHTLAVEQLQAREAETGTSDGNGTIAYAFNPEVLSRIVDNEEYVVVVASTRLADDTIWNPSEKVFFAQDLMFMIRAFMQENPAMFARTPPARDGQGDQV